MLFRYLVLFSFLLVSGCDEGDPQTTSPADEVSQQEIRIALVMKTLTNPFFVAMEQGAREAEQELGIKLLVRTAAEETSANQQIRIVEQLVEKESVQAIVIAPADSVGLIPALKKAQDKGIVVINLDNRLDSQFSVKAGLKDVPFISIDNKQSAYLSAKFIADQVSRPSKAVIIEGIREAQNALDRRDGALKAFSENSRINLVASESARWKIDEAYDVAERLFTADPEISLVFAANDMMALGVIEFLRKSGRNDVLIAGFDAIGDARQAIETGTLQVTIDQQPGRQGYLGVQAAYDLLAGKDVDAEIMLDGLMVTR